MTMAESGRIVTLDIVRGVAVMGILTMNIVVFAMPVGAAMNPLVFGTESAADLASWTFSFIFFDGRMRGLFSFLFGASMLLVIERAQASGRSAAIVHFARMGWLLVFGLLHYFLIWFGDILTTYAVTGMVAFAFRNSPVTNLLAAAAAFLLLQFMMFTLTAGGFYMTELAAMQPGATMGSQLDWQQMQSGVGYYSADHLQRLLGLYRGAYGGLVQFMLTAKWDRPIESLIVSGPETLAYFLIGIAAYRSGFLTGAWGDGRYRHIAAIGFGIGIPAYAALASVLLFTRFHVPTIFAVEAATVVVRPLMIVATAALIILLTRRGGRLVDRIAAAGRAAFTNYVATSLLMTFFFYGWGLGLYGSFTRSELWLFVLGGWALMLLWSKPWLDRFRYGPFEWMWRSLARGRLQRISRRPNAAGALT